MNIQRRNKKCPTKQNNSIFAPKNNKNEYVKIKACKNIMTHQLT